MPKVSIIIPLYNMERYIKECVESALNQTCADTEVIVVDDGSTDNSPMLLEGFGDKITVIRQKNQGPAKALNNGIRAATGDFIAWMGSDDLYLPDFVEEHLNKFEKEPYLDIIYTDYIIIDAKGNEIKTVKCPSPLSYPLFIKMLLTNNFINGSTVMMRKECFEKVGYYDETLKASVDADMWFRLLFHNCKFGHIPIPLVKYRWHPSNQSHKFKLMQKYRDEVHLKAFKSFSEKSLFDDTLELKELSYAFASQFSFRAAIAVEEKIAEKEKGFSLRRTFLMSLYKIMGKSLFIDLIGLIVYVRRKIIANLRTKR